MIIAVWLVKAKIDVSRKDKSPLLYSRRFQLIEKKYKEKNDICIPNDAAFVQSIMVEVGRNLNDKFVGSRDQCDKEDEKPVFSLNVGNDNRLWPVIIVEQKGILFCCLCYVNKQKSPEQSSYNPSISTGISVLRCLTEYFRVPSSQEFQSRLKELSTFLNEAVPLGVPRDTNCDSILAKMSDKSLSLSKSQKIKQPAWKPVLHKNKSTISLTISECIQATQCEEEQSKDILEVYGSITCKAEIEGVTSDITFNISYLSEGLVAPLDNLVTHHCVQSVDSDIIQKECLNVKPLPRRIRFLPPYDVFTLCQYTVTRVQELPIFGVYNIKCNQKSASISVNLQLSDQVKNNFEYVELHIPFFDRGSFVIIDQSVSQGSLNTSSDKQILVWNIGSKFPSKSLDVNLTTTIHFTEKSVHANSISDSDVFCTGSGSYCQLFFKINDFTYSGCYIDPKSIQVSSSIKLKLNSKREFVSSSYRIWNSRNAFSAI